MAINQTAVALNACTKISSATTALLDALDELEAVSEQLTAAGITLANYDDAIAAGGGIAQADGNTFQYVAGACQAEIVRALKAYYSGSPTQQAWAAMQKVRP